MKIWTFASMTLLLASQGLAQPAIKSNGVVNASGYQAKLAPDTVFVIFGSGIGPATLAAVTAPDYPASIGSTSVTFTPAAGGTAVTAKMVYAVAGQVAGLLPSSIAPGTYAVRVTYNNQVSAPQNVTVVARSFGIATANSGGTGTAQATVGNVNGGVSLTRFTTGSLAFNGLNWTLTPAHPGDSLVLWGTGGGADPANDTGGTSGDQTAAGNFIVNVGGRQITSLYAGASSGYPGLWQINFTLPAHITPDCFASLQVSAGGELSNAVVIPIADVGQSTCSAPGFDQATLSKLDAGGSIVFAGLSIGKINTTGSSFPAMGSGVIEQVGGVINRYTAADWILPYSGPKFGPCSVFAVTYASGTTQPGNPSALLDAGAKLAFSGPNVLAGATVGAFVGPVGPAYSSTLPAGTLMEGGAYTLAGAGGTQVGPFIATATLPSNFSVTNWSSISSINRSTPLTINWTGAGFDQVLILVQGATLGASNHNVAISCVVPESLGTFSIPAAALAYLPAAAAGAAGNVGQLTVEATMAGAGTLSAQSSTAQTLTPPLVGGGQADFGSFAPFLAVEKSVAIQ
ncbi:MAG: hypothetical protein ABI165_04860 [Bryobacteraceae bacterium]